MATEPTPLTTLGGYWATRWYDDEGTRRAKRFGSTAKVKKAEARRAFNNWLVKWKNDPTVRNPGGEAATWTIEKLRDAYHDYAKTYYRKPDGQDTKEANGVWNAMRYVVDLYGDTLAREFSPSMLKAARDWMSKDNLARTSINQRVNRIRRVFKWAVENEIVPSSVLVGLQAVQPLKRGRSTAKETDAVKPVARAEVDAVLPKLPSPVVAMVELQWLTGMRSGEVTAMRACDIEMGGNVWLYRPPSHKTEHHGIERTIPLGPKAQEVIRPFLKRKLDAYLFDPREAMAERYANCNTHRRPNQQPKPRKTDRTLCERYTSQTYRRAIDYAVKAINKRAKSKEQMVNAWTPLQLRHACATRVRKSHGLEASRTILGHTKASTTEIYAEMDKETASRVMAEIG